MPPGHDSPSTGPFPRTSPLDSARFRRYLFQGAEALGFRADDEALEKFDRYRAELKKWGRVHNLAGNLDDIGILSLHFLDSIAFLKALPDSDGLRVADLGSGAGFPGIPMVLLRKNLTMNLIEPRSKRCAFLRHLLRVLELGNVNIIEARAEVCADQTKTFDVVVSRAVAPLPEVWRYGSGLLRKGGRLVVGKGRDVSEELKSVRTCYRIKSFRLPFENVNRSLIILIS